MVGLDLKISYAGLNKEVVVIEARGYIDTTTSPEFSKQLEKQLAQGKYKIVVNLQGVDYISSTGWGVFIGNLREIRDHGGDIVLANMVPGVRNIFELMEFSSILKDYDSLDNAQAYFLRTGVKARPSDIKARTHEGIQIKKEELQKKPPGEIPSKPAAEAPVKKPIILAPPPPAPPTVESIPKEPDPRAYTPSATPTDKAAPKEPEPQAPTPTVKLMPKAIPKEPEPRAPTPAVKPTDKEAPKKPERAVPSVPSSKPVSPSPAKRTVPSSVSGIPPVSRPVAKRTPKKPEGLDEITIFQTGRNELGRRILRIVSDYPYYDIKEIAKALKLPEYGWKKVSIHAIKNELKEMGLSDKKARYEFVTRRRT